MTYETSSNPSTTCVSLTAQPKLHNGMRMATKYLPASSQISSRRAERKEGRNYSKNKKQKYHCPNPYTKCLSSFSDVTGLTHESEPIREFSHLDFAADINSLSCKKERDECRGYFPRSSPLRCNVPACLPACLATSLDKKLPTGTWGDDAPRRLNHEVKDGLHKDVQKGSPRPRFCRPPVFSCSGVWFSREGGGGKKTTFAR